MALNKKYIEDIVAHYLNETELFPVAVIIKPNNAITVIIDSDTGVTIDDCVNVSRFVEKSLNRDEEDFELRVMSAGADTPFTSLRQYQKNMGKDVRITLNDGEKVDGILMKIDETEVVLNIAPVMKKGQKPGKHHIVQQRSIMFKDIKDAKAIIKF